MPENWSSYRLGELFRRVDVRVGSYDIEPDVLSVTKHQGIVRAAEFFKNRVASRDLSKYKVVRSGAFAYSTIHIDEGAVARNRIGVDGVVSPMYTVMEFVGAADEVSVDYVDFLLRTPTLRRAYKAGMRGSVHRRQSLPFDNFAAIVVDVPPPDQQQRIVELLAAAQAAADAARLYADALHDALESVIGAFVEHISEAETRALGELAAVESGISWKKEDEVPPGPSTVPVMGVSNVQREYVHADGCVHLRGTSKARSKLIRPHTLLTIRTNGNAERIGNVHRAPHEAVGCTFSSFLTAITTHDPEVSDYVLRVLQSPQVQRKISDATTGSTGLKNIAVRFIRSIAIPWPDATVRQALVDRAAAVSAAVDAASRHRDQLAALAGELASAFTSGDKLLPRDADARVPEAVLS